MEVVSPGSYYRKNRTEYIVYKESELTGLDGVTTIIKVHDDGTIHLVRTGKMQHKQEYKKGKSYQLTITVQEDNANGNERTTEAGH